MSDYNGWKNYETWNVALWIQNDEGIYRIARHNKASYRDFARCMVIEHAYDQTPDGARWLDENLDYEALDEMIREL